MTIQLPPDAGPEWAELVATINQHFDENQRVRVLGSPRNTGTGSDVEVRFLASPATQFVQVHVQSDSGAGSGGATYDSTNFVSSTRTDCRNSRQQDITVSRDGASHYYLFLIPVLEMDGNFIKQDGENGQPDRMTILDLAT